MSDMIVRQEKRYQNWIVLYKWWLEESWQRRQEGGKTSKHMTKCTWWILCMPLIKNRDKGRSPNTTRHVRLRWEVAPENSYRIRNLWNKCALLIRRSGKEGNYRVVWQPWIIPNRMRVLTTAISKTLKAGRMTHKRSLDSRSEGTR